MKRAAESSSEGMGRTVAVRWRVGLLVGALLGAASGFGLNRLVAKRGR